MLFHFMKTNDEQVDTNGSSSIKNTPIEVIDKDTEENNCSIWKSSIKNIKESIEERMDMCQEVDDDMNDPDDGYDDTNDTEE